LKKGEFISSLYSVPTGCEKRLSSAHFADLIKPTRPGQVLIGGESTGKARKQKKYGIGFSEPRFYTIGARARKTWSFVGNL
jgi:hypothetical protein